ncbi:MAG TPA: hypothetical protein VHZ74_23755 [Bryobacteraceae bacterium]|nr:hypothetical protein [Bryobacteraceae bacterium]
MKIPNDIEGGDAGRFAQFVEGNVAQLFLRKKLHRVIEDCSLTL